MEGNLLLFFQELGSNRIDVDLETKTSPSVAILR
jgi:hypothetical protein